MKYFILICFLSLSSLSYAGMDFSMMSGGYTVKIKDFKEETLTKLKDIIQQVGEKKAVHLKIKSIQDDLDKLAIKAGQAQNESYIELQTKLEDVLKDRLVEIVNKYDGNVYRGYFDTVAQTIMELKKFEIPESVGAWVYSGCEVISRRKL